MPKPKAYDSTPVVMKEYKKEEERRRKEILIPAGALWEYPVLPPIYI